MGDDMDVIEAIRSRRSVREFTKDDLDDLVVEKILDAGRWAPSGLNNQAWRFIVVRDNGTKEELSMLTHSEYAACRSFHGAWRCVAWADPE